MKLITNKPAFTPREIMFVFESQEELDAMAALFNHVDVCEAIREASQNAEMPSKIRTALQQIGGNCDNAWPKISHLTSSKTA